jgi:hypothetical protein
MMRGGRANTFMNEKNALLCWGASFSTSHLDILSKLNIKYRISRKERVDWVEAQLDLSLIWSGRNNRGERERKHL